MRKRIEMADIIALAFELGVVAVAEFLDKTLDLHKGVGDDIVLGLLDVGLFPIIFPIADLVGHVKDPKIH